MMCTPGSAQLWEGAFVPVLNTIVRTWSDEFEFPISGDETTKAAPFYASIEHPQRAGKTALQDIIAETHAAKEKAGREQHAKTSQPS